MPKVTPFKGIRPNPSVVERVAALPYDVYNRKEACEVVKNEPLSFLNIDRAETQFSDDVDTYAPCVYEKARELKPEQKDLWLNGLYRVYYNLQMGPEFDEIEKLMQ